MNRFFASKLPLPLSWSCSQLPISRPMVLLPAITSWSQTGWTNTMESRSISSPSRPYFEKITM